MQTIKHKNVRETRRETGNQQMQPEQLSVPTSKCVQCGQKGEEEKREKGRRETVVEGGVVERAVGETARCQRVRLL